MKVIILPQAKPKFIQPGEPIYIGCDGCMYKCPGPSRILFGFNHDIKDIKEGTKLL